ncbi:hypothetical protein GCM10009069_04320 [Algimonas arctica]|uniref:Uncharacterized protein n=1 Tax=Algimonas arctica TaxID=1479486 RepID=A0A8J3G1A7_9PROT|nr:hypothetical protein [Algimonas arctica]GHA84070.1 hypothetical protein GCM10009069_04320 [Algimonas arctica]
MARRPTISEDMREQLSKLNRNDIKAIARLPTLETDDPEFGQLFMRNPGAALAAKGLELDPKEIVSIQEKIDKLSDIRAGGIDKVETEVGIKVKVKF